MCQFLPDSYGFMYGLIQLIRLKTEHPKIQEVRNFVTLLFQCLVALLGGIALLDVWNVTCDTDTFHVCVVSFRGGMVPKVFLLPKVFFLLLLLFCLWC